MMEERVYVTKEEADEIMKQRGEVRGGTLKEDIASVEQAMGKEVADKVKRAAKLLPYPIDYDNIKELAWYPAGLTILSVFFLKRYFNWTDKEVREQGYTTPKVSPIMKFFISLFGNLHMFLKQAPKVWRDYWTEGELCVVLEDEKNKKAVLELKDFILSDFYKLTLEGYVERVFQFFKKGAKCKIERAGKGDTIWKVTLTW